MSAPRITFGVVGVTRDRRTHEQLCRAAAMVQQHQDQQLELLWRRRVAENVARRALAKAALIVAGEPA